MTRRRTTATSTAATSTSTSTSTSTFRKLAFTHLLAATASLQLGLFYAANNNDNYRDAQMEQHRRQHYQQNRRRNGSGGGGANGDGDDNCNTTAGSSSSSSSEKTTTTRSLLVPYARVASSEFERVFDLGAPLHVGNRGQSGQGATNVLFLKLFANDDNDNDAAGAYRNDGNGSIPLLSLRDAAEGCDVVQHVVVSSGNRGKGRNGRTCHAFFVVENPADDPRKLQKQDPYRISKWIRRRRKTGALETTRRDRRKKQQQQQQQQQQSQNATGSNNNNNEEDNSYYYYDRVGRYEFGGGQFASENGVIGMVPDSRSAVPTSEKLLRRYLQEYPDALERLRPIAARVANAGGGAVATAAAATTTPGGGVGGGSNNTTNANSTSTTKGTIMVYVCNSGHAELFANFVCAAKAVGMDLSKVLLFATDEGMRDAARGLGVATFYHEGVFDSIPSGAAAAYGDDHYALVMMSKVYCVHLVSQLGYDIFVSTVPSDRPANLGWFLRPFFSIISPLGLLSLSRSVLR